MFQAGNPRERISARAGKGSRSRKRRRVQIGLNKGRPRMRSLAPNLKTGLVRSVTAVSRTSAPASGLKLVGAAIVLWNPVYLERAGHF